MSLSEHIAGIWQDCRHACTTDEVHQRAGRHLMAQLACSTRHTISNLLCMGNQMQQDWTADYRMYAKARVDSRKVLGVVRQQLVDDLQPHDALVVAMDDSILRRSGKKIHGSAYRRDPLSPAFQTNLVLGQRVLQLSAIYPLPDDDWRGVPIAFEHTPTPRKPKRDADPADQTAYVEAKKDATMGRCGARELTRLRQELDDDGHTQRHLISVVDGRFTVGSLLQDLPTRSTLIGRIRKDARLYHLPVSQPATGRRRIWGTVAPTPEELRIDADTPWREIQLDVRGKRHSFRVKTLQPVRWKPSGKQELKILVIAPVAYGESVGGAPLYREPAYLLCTDPQMSDEAILRHYIRRWDIEVNFRDEKTLLGVGQAQVGSEQSTQHVPALAVAGYGMLQLIAARHHEDLELLSRPKWQRDKGGRPSTPRLLQLYRHELFGQSIQRASLPLVSSCEGPDQTLQKLLPDPYSSLIRPTG